MRKLLPVLIVLILCLPLLALPAHAQEATAEPTAEATTSAAVTAEPTAETTTSAEATEAPTGTVTAVPTAAPEGETGEAPTGLSTLVLLIGLGAVALVGLSSIARNNLQNRTGNKS
ncbi:MAG: hypothetical protein HZC41_12455 [Chloroflexi bacterium]|nr:hypothetical protein [Chloroflexota bacterium]